MLLAEPREAEAVADLLVGRRDEEQVAGRAEALARERRDRDRARRDLALHVERAAPPDLAVAQLARPRIGASTRPDRRARCRCARAGRDGAAAAAGDPRDEIRPLRHPGVELARDAVRLEVAAQMLGGARLVPGRVDRVEPDQLLQEVVTSSRTSVSVPEILLASRPPERYLRRDERPLLRRGDGSAPARSRRSRSGFARGRSTSSSASSTSSARGRRCGSRSPRTASARSILYGPPGSGKTTLARIVADATGAAFEELSAVSATVGERPRGDRARPRAARHERQRTILFLDEIHRFNKAQQDALLPAVEEGLLTLIGATTENPYFEVNSALLSRSQLYELEPLDEERPRGARAARARRTLGVELAPTSSASSIARRAGGDARNALNILELAAAVGPRRGRPIAEAHVEDAARKRPLVYDKGGDAHYDFISAFIKSIARLRPRRRRLLPRGDARGRRGRALHRAADDRPRLRGHRQRRPARAARRRRGGAGGRARRHARGAAQPAQAAIYLARAPKSNASLRRARRGDRGRPRARAPAPADALRDAHYAGAKKLGRGEGYVYPHDDPRGFEVDHLPDELKGRTYYRPVR